MTLPEFFGCSLITFGPPFSLFLFTIANDPIRIIILIAAAFLWLLSLLVSSIFWFVLVRLYDVLAIGVFFSVLFQEGFRYAMYKILQRTEAGLEAIASSQLNESRHTLAYVSGLGFGIMSAAFVMVDLLADMIGPGTVGLKGGSEFFFLTSALQALSIILLHTFWNVIFFNAFDTNNYLHVGYVVSSHLFVSLLTLLNVKQLYIYTLLPNYCITLLTWAIAYTVAGGSLSNLIQFSKLLVQF